MDYEAMKDAVDAYLAEINVTYSVVNRGVRMVKPEKSEHSVGWPAQKAYEQDRWEVAFKRTPGGASSRTIADIVQNYYTGTAHRTPNKSRDRPNTHYWLLAEKQRKPVAPRAADVLYSLISDGDAINQSFHDWASDFGADTDSIKMLNTYNECCKIGREMRAVFNHSEREKLADLVRDL